MPVELVPDADDMPRDEVPECEWCAKLFLFLCEAFDAVGLIILCNLEFD